nr:ribonuclease H-like domain-containing protein [Tanacetum cinerariifolium]
MPPKPDLSFTGLDEFSNKPVAENTKSTEEETKAFRKNADALIIKEWGNPQMDLQDKGVINSGCSRHMTGNMSYLTDYEEIDGGYVAFGRNPKGGKITRKDTIKTDHKVKVIRCDNRTEFKNSEMNQFCEMKGILRQYSVARTPQQNRVAKRRNRILIETARTMLADSKLPTTFWAEAVNTACYVQRFLCWILFEWFGLDWLFDIDALTKTMNYEPIVAGTQSNGFADGKEIIITESPVRRDLRLADEEGVDYLLNSTIFENLELMGTMASAIVCLATNQKFSFSKLIFDSMIRNLDNASGKILMYPRLVRPATTASSLKAEQDNSKTQSKATPNEASSLGTTLGGGPRCQDTMRDTIAQTRFENVSKLSNDSQLARGNTLQSDEDRKKLNELMKLCTNLQTRVLDLKKTKTTQVLKITSLKRRVKKLKKKQRSRTHKLERLYKVGLTARVDSSEDEQSLGEDASKQERKINDIDADEDITLINDQDDAKMFDVNDLHGEEVFVDKDVVDKEVNDEVQKVVEEVVEDINTTKLIGDAAQVNAAGEVNATSIATTDDVQAKIDADYQMAERLQAEEQSKKQKVDDDKETAELKKLMEIVPNEKEVEIDAIPLAVKSSKIVDWKIHKEGKKSYYQTIRADGKFKMCMVFNIMLKEFDREVLEDLYKLVKAKYGSTRPVVFTTVGTRVKTVSESYYCQYKEVTATQVEVSAAQELQENILSVYYC